MRPVDIAAVAVIVILVVFAIWYARGHHDCSGDCRNCHTGCSGGQGQTPDFVRRYRRDHPGSSHRDAGDSSVQK